MIQDNPNRNGPVFLFTIHRSGGTALSRILNCHPDMCVWGEHGGFINQLAEIDEIMGLVPLKPSSEKKELIDYIAATEDAMSRFDPWRSPVSRMGFRAWAHRYIRSAFVDMLPEGKRWGFKEIRYNHPRTARFLKALFPDCLFITLTRDIGELCVSNMLVPWSIEYLEGTGVYEHESSARDAIDDCVYALLAIEHNFALIAQELPDSTLAVRYPELVGDTAKLIDRISSFTGLEVNGADRARIDRTVSRRSGQTDLGTTFGALSKDLILDALPGAVRKAKNDLARNGPDVGRLKRLGHAGRFSFLAGDHAMRDTPLSSMF